MKNLFRSLGFRIFGLLVILSGCIGVSYSSYVAITNADAVIDGKDVPIVDEPVGPDGNRTNVVTASFRHIAFENTDGVSETTSYIDADGDGVYEYGTQESPATITQTLFDSLSSFISGYTTSSIEDQFGDPYFDVSEGQEPEPEKTSTVAVEVTKEIAAAGASYAFTSKNEYSGQTATYTVYFPGGFTSKGVRDCTVTVGKNTIGCTTYTRSWAADTEYTLTGTVYVTTNAWLKYDTFTFNDLLQETCEIPKGYAMSYSLVKNLVNKDDSSFIFHALLKANNETNDGWLTYSEALAAGQYYDYEEALDTDYRYYALFNSFASTLGVSSITNSINSATSGTLNVYNSATAPYPVSQDHTYFSGTNSFALGTTKEGGETTIASGVTVNLCINDGKSKVEATSGDSHVTETSSNVTSANYSVEPEGFRENSYTVVLNNDLYLNGTLSIGSVFGHVLYTSHGQGFISGEYVCLDLNGHDIYISSSGSLMSYGLIKDSVGTGCIYNSGGILKTLVVAYDAKGGDNTLASISANLMPFILYNIPYLRCRVEFSYNTTSKSWGYFQALCRYNTMSSNVTNFDMYFVGDSNSANPCFFALDVPDDPTNAKMVFEFERIDGIKESIGSSYLTSNEYKKCLDIKLNFSFYHMDFTLGSMTFTIEVYGFPYTVDTTKMVFPITSFVDISFYDSSITFEQQVQFQPGITVYADKDSSLILSGSTTNSTIGGFYACNSPYDFWKNGQWISLSNISHNYTEGFLNSQHVWKYFDAAKIDCYGTLYLDKAANNSMNTSSAPYVMSGDINIAKVGYVGETPTTDIDAFFQETVTNNTCYIQTYGIDFLGCQGDSLYYKATCGPLNSFKTAYVYSNASSQSYSMYGTFDSTEGVFTRTDNGSGDTYFLYKATRDSFSATENRRVVTLQKCDVVTYGVITYDSTTFVYFAGLYCPLSTGSYTNTSATYTLNTYNLRNGTTAVKFNSTAKVWTR